MNNWPPFTAIAVPMGFGLLRFAYLWMRRQRESPWRIALRWRSSGGMADLDFAKEVSLPLA